LQKSVEKSEGLSTKRNRALDRNYKIKTDKIVQVEKISSKPAQIEIKITIPLMGREVR
jgi:hypothetical protein